MSTGACDGAKHLREPDRPTTRVLDTLVAALLAGGLLGVFATMSHEVKAGGVNFGGREARIPLIRLEAQ